MSSELKEKLDEIALLLVMTSEDDPVGLGLIGEMCGALAALAKTTPGADRLARAADYIEALVKQGGPNILQVLSEFTTVGALVLEGQSGEVFPHERESTGTTNSEPKWASGTDSPKHSTGGDNLGTYSITGERDILVEFAAEAEEHLGNVEEIILDSEGSYTKDAIDTIFRGVHSLKGGSAYFNLDEITKTSHLLENLLDEVRSDKRNFDEELKALVLRYIDLQKNLINKAKAAAAGDGTLQRTRASAEFLEALRGYVDGNKAPVQAQSKPSSVPPNEVAKEVAESDSKPSEGGNSKTFVKIETSRLDHLIDSIGEMAIYSTMLVRLCREHLGRNETVLKTTRQVEKFARDLQDIGMSMRLVPIKGLFQKMSRLVWDTGKRLKKDITFDMEGEDTELDRNIIDKLADPLMHMVRNAIDHGVETPEERLANGKPAQGRVKLSAYHSGGNIHIAIEDNGRGLNKDKLVKKAIEKGIIQEGEKLTEQEIFDLIFAPGFSTAAVVTDVSGRGVGMDVVKRNVEALRGHINIKSELNVGSTFVIEIPLTLAMIDGIEIRVGTEHFIVPSLSIVEFIQPEAKSLSATLDQGETFHFRGKYLPVFRLAELYGISPEYADPTEATLIVVENNSEQVALMVDGIVGEYSAVIKSLSSLFQGGQGLSGCAIMPDGSVALILDVRHVIQLARTQRRSVSTFQTSEAQPAIH